LSAPPNTALQRSGWIRAILASRSRKRHLSIYQCNPFSRPLKPDRSAATINHLRVFTADITVLSTTLSSTNFWQRRLSALIRLVSRAILTAFSLVSVAQLPIGT
jgi:hypothetical protein